MRFEAIEEHKSDNPTPIIVRKGTRVKAGNRSDDSGCWPNWIYCYSLDGTSEGWTPEQIIQIEGEYGIVLEDYSAKELEVRKGEIVEGDIELNGWIWCSKLNGLEEGWLPKEKLCAIRYNLQFEKLCNILKLGDIVGEPKAISGGLLHKMYAAETTQGKYAIKALNPQIMLRPVAMQRFIHSEQIASIALNNIPSLPAKKFRGTSLQEMDKQYYLVFDWVDGKTLKPNEINRDHCEKIGAILEDIHRIDFSELGIVNNSSDKLQLTNWNYYLQKGQENNTIWVNLLLEILAKLYDWNAQANKAAQQLAADMVISHRDLDPKNVMWNEDNPIIIDWESAGYTNPMEELTETAIYWSENEMGDIDKERFLAFIGGYKKKYGTLQANWRTVLANGFLGKLGWLEYNLKRSLRIECTEEEEQKMGTAQVTETIKAIRRYADMIPQLEEWLNNNI